MDPRERGRELIYTGGQFWLLSKEMLEEMEPHGCRDSEDEAPGGQPPRVAKGNCRRSRRMGKTQDEDSVHQLGG